MGFILTRFSTTNRRDSSRRRGERALWALLDGTARQQCSAWRSAHYARFLNLDSELWLSVGRLLASRAGRDRLTTRASELQSHAQLFFNMFTAQGNERSLLALTVSVFFARRSAQ